LFEEEAEELCMGRSHSNFISLPPLQPFILDIQQNLAKLINKYMAQEDFSKKISQKIGFLKPGWWIVHLAGITLVYALGHLLWR